MVAILEKTEHNTDFHQIVDFLEASHIRVETTDGETKILAKEMSNGEAFPTVTRLDAGKDKENIAKTSAMPYKALLRVTSHGCGDGSMQQKLQKLMDIYTSLQRQHSLMEEMI
nr:hypothetical protein [Tanacetum cinerariifolium]